MKQKKQVKLQQFFKKQLLDETLMFWKDHAADTQYGGFTDYLDRDGNLLSTEKGGWIQGRATWLYSWVYNNIEKDSKWLETAELGARFLLEHGFDSDGRMFFRYKQDGTPIVQRRYLFTEIFGVIGLAEYSKASGSEAALTRALETVKLIDKLTDPKSTSLPSKILPEAYQLEGHSMTMILINMYQVLREVTEDKQWNERIDYQIDLLFDKFVKPEWKAVLETVQSNGEILDTPEGRIINPGHAIETAWFLLEESEYRKDLTLQKKALEILDWSVERGWDKKEGGLFSFLDLKGKHPAPIEWSMKYWWPHCELIYASLLAWKLTNDQKYLKLFKKTKKYSYRNFRDKKAGEWFGYLNRDGSVALTVKGNHFKGPFHIPRMEGKCLILLNQLAQ